MYQLMLLMDRAAMCVELNLQIIQQHVVPDKALTEFSISNNQKLDTLLAGSPLTVSLHAIWSQVVPLPETQLWSLACARLHIEGKMQAHPHFAWHYMFNAH